MIVFLLFIFMLLIAGGFTHLLEDNKPTHAIILVVTSLVFSTIIFWISTK